MIDGSRAFSGFGVDDAARAMSFYGETLGLGIEQDEMGERFGMFRLVLGAGRHVLVYQRPDNVPAEYTILNFPVDDVEATVDELRARGVAFEHYEGEMQTDERGIFRGGGPHIAWFKDPAGNVLAVMQDH